MSEISNHIQQKRQDLLSFSKGMVEGGNGIDLLETYKSSIAKVTPEDIVVVVDALVATSYPMQTLKTGINKILNVFYKSIANHEWEKPPKGHFLYDLMLENYHLRDKLAKMRPLIKDINKKTGQLQITAIQNLKKALHEIKKFEIHYQKKEHILFPYFEHHFPEYKCLQVMWSMHDDIRKHQDDLELILDAENVDLKTFNRSIGDLFFAMHAIAFREDQILFPIAHKYVPDEDWNEMHQQSFEIGFAFIETPEYRSASIYPGTKEGFIDLETGRMTVEQLIQVMNHLPLDITFVDDNNEVAYFSSPKDRFFTRSKAIIGRKVNNCHPPESVHVVEEIINSFKEGKKNKASFWLTIKDKFLLIQYFAVRSNEGNYMGTLEVTQDISEIKKLEGEQRLLDWDSLSR